MGCNNSTQVEAPGNKFQFMNENYAIMHGLLEDYGKSASNLYMKDLYLYSDGINVYTSSHSISLNGSGNGLHFEMYTTQRHGLAPGKYCINKDLAFSENTCKASAVNLGLDYDEHQCAAIHEMKSGEINVSRDNSIYTIQVNAICQNGKQLSGFYQGPLEYFDVTSKK